MAHKKAPDAAERHTSQQQLGLHLLFGLWLLMCNFSQCVGVLPVKLAWQNYLRRCGRYGCGISWLKCESWRFTHSGTVLSTTTTRSRGSDRSWQTVGSILSRGADGSWCSLRSDIEENSQHRQALKLTVDMDCFVLLAPVLTLAPEGPEGPVAPWSPDWPWTDMIKTLVRLLKTVLMPRINIKINIMGKANLFSSGFEFYYSTHLREQNFKFDIYCQLNIQSTVWLFYINMSSQH